MLKPLFQDEDEEEEDVEYNGIFETIELNLATDSEVEALAERTHQQSS